MNRVIDQPASVMRRRYHASAGSILYIMTTTFLAIGAINSQNNLLFFAFGLGAGALVVSGLVSGPALMGVRVRRDVPVHAEVGRRLEIRYTVQNLSRLSPAFGLSIRERLRADGTKEIVRAIVGCVEHVGAGETVVATAVTTPISRGVLSLDAFTVTTTFPLGLARKSVYMSQHKTLVVRPRIFSLRADLLSPLGAAGARVAGSRGIPGLGDDIIGLREYRPGDPQRAVAWRASARVGSLVVRQTALPAPARVWVVLHHSLAAVSEHEQEIGISLAASIALLADRRGFAVGLRGLGCAVLPRPGRRSVDRVLDALAEFRIDANQRIGQEARSLRDPSIVVARSRADAAASTGSVVLCVDEAASFLAPGHVLPDAPPLPPSRWKRGINTFLGFEEASSADTDARPSRHAEEAS